MAERNLSPPDEFDKELRRGAADRGLALDGGACALLGEYFRLVSAWNPRLHLVAPCTPAEFASRHALESLAALPYLAQGASFVDVGSGAGLPALPCLVARPDLRATLVESSRRKAVFLREAASALGLRGRMEVVAERFQGLAPPAADALTCRAVERFTELVPSIASWASNVPTLLLFGGESLGESISRAGLAGEAVRLAGSEKRFLFVVSRASQSAHESQAALPVGKD
ncbi:MAG TPA: RsmG family class I SAM-dependent methyltransferase [Pyrinomonadaceae bacterium]|nr:RsmG family class I SAM-dependent methyltransferase [Pyrinomonadaceae bacterium]